MNTEWKMFFTRVMVIVGLNLIFTIMLMLVGYIQKTVREFVEVWAFFSIFWLIFIHFGLFCDMVMDQGVAYTLRSIGKGIAKLLRGVWTKSQ